jgi:hypothetical protein
MMSVPSSNLPDTTLNVNTPTVKTPSTADDVNEFLKPDKIDDVKDDKKDDKKDDEEIDLLEDEEDEKLDLEDDKKDKKDKKKKDDDELNEDDEEDEDDDEVKDDDEIDIEAPPRKKDIVAAYPDFFKKFPWMEKMMYRDQRYTELFGSFDDAKEVAESAQVLATFEQDLVKGNTETILKQIKDNSPKSWNKIVDNYLGTLAKVDKEAYFEVAGSVGKEIILNLVTDAQNRLQADPKDETGKTLKQVASILNQFLFGSTTFTPHKPRVEGKEEGDSELDNERKEFMRERFVTVRDELQTKIDRTLRATISEYIDPKGEMSDYVKKNAIRDAINMVHQQFSIVYGIISSPLNFLRILSEESRKHT